MPIKCDKCDKQATIHMTDIVDGVKSEVHFCEECAATAGLAVKATMPLSELLEEFVLQKSSGPEHVELTCESCGMTFSEFRKDGLLGCPNDYDAFCKPMEEILERAHEGATHHAGKVPPRASQQQKTQTAILRLRTSLRQAVAMEDYEQAARLRDQIKQLEGS